MLSVFSMRNLSLIRSLSSLAAKLWLSLMVVFTKISTFGFNESEARIAVKSFGIHGIIQESVLKHKQNK